MTRQRACAPIDILCRRDRAVVTTFGRAGIRPATHPRRHFSDTSPARRPFSARPHTVTAAARQLREHAIEVATRRTYRQGEAVDRLMLCSTYLDQTGTR